MLSSSAFVECVYRLEGVVAHSRHLISATKCDMAAEDVQQEGLDSSKAATLDLQALNKWVSAKNELSMCTS